MAFSEFLGRRPCGYGYYSHKLKHHSKVSIIARQGGLMHKAYKNFSQKWEWDLCAEESVLVISMHMHIVM